MVKFNDKGDEVRRLQQRLIAEGYSLPVYGADGHLGDETWDALQQYAEEQRVRWDPIVPTDVMTDLFADTTVPELPTIPAPDAELDGVKIIDLLSERDPARPPLSRKTKRPKWKMGRNGLVVMRNARNITGVTIHQTAVEFGVSNQQLKAAGGDVQLALARRGLDVACHSISFDGFFARTTPLAYYVYHGNGFNGFELGLEIDGLYPGVVGGRTWNREPPTKLTEGRVFAARAAMKDLVTRGREANQPIRYLHAHRQSSETRRSDPGEALWKAVVLEYAVPVLKLELNQSRVLRDGRPVPKEWDPNGVGSY